MQIVVTGGTGFIGRPLCASLCQEGHRITLLTRRIQSATVLWLNRHGRRVEWPRSGRPGSTVSKVPMPSSISPVRRLPMDAGLIARKQLLTESRVLTTRLLVEAMSRRSSKPRTLISASGIGYYGASDDRVLDEGAARGQGFLADLCLAWEAEALRAAEFGVRVVMLRTGMVLEQDGGALPKMLLPFQLFAGGPIMPGTQWVSWIHRA